MARGIYLNILECSDGTYYVGVTNDLNRRFNEHRSGFNETAYTHNRRTVKRVYSGVFHDYLLALEWETRIRNWSHAKKKALVEGKFEDMKVL